MCNFMSLLVLKNKQVLYLPGQDSHDQLLVHFGLEAKDNTLSPEDMQFARVELVPASGVIFEPVQDWKFILDENITPSWFSPAHEEAVRAAAIAYQQAVIDSGYFAGNLYLERYGHPLPEGFTHCGGYLFLEGYDHPLPEGFTHCGGDLYLRGYGHPLPEGFTHCGKNLYLRGYDHPLPKGFTHCGGDLDLRRYGHPLPKGFTHCGGYLDLRRYGHPLPEGFTPFTSSQRREA